ncbi:MAG: hypothetical protein AAF267_17870 [Deinococcota bacterium]
MPYRKREVGSVTAYAQPADGDKWRATVWIEAALIKEEFFDTEVEAQTLVIQTLKDLREASELALERKLVMFQPDFKDKIRGGSTNG